MTDRPLTHIPTQFIEPPRPEESADTFGPRASFPVQHDRAETAPERDEEAVAATPAAPPPPADAEGPQPLFAGTYAIYDDQQGGFVLVICTREGETHHKHLPGHLVKMAEKMMGDGSPLGAMFGGLF